MIDEPINERRARRVVRVRALTDPLGAKGIRQTANRLDRERRARRTVFGLAFAAFVALFWLLGGTSRVPTKSGTAPAAPIVTQDRAAVVGGGKDVTIYRFVEPPYHAVTRTS